MYVSIFSTLLLLQDSWQGKRFIKSQLCDRYKLIKLGSTAEWLACIADLVKPNSKGKNEALFPSPWPPPPCNNGLLFISQYLQETANSPNLNGGGAVWTVLFSEVTPWKDSVSTILLLIVVFLSLPFFHVYAMQIPYMWDIWSFWWPTGWKIKEFSNTSGH